MNLVGTIRHYTGQACAVVAEQVNTAKDIANAPREEQVKFAAKVCLAVFLTYSVASLAWTIAKIILSALWTAGVAAIGGAAGAKLATADLKEQVTQLQTTLTTKLDTIQAKVGTAT